MTAIQKTQTTATEEPLIQTRSLSVSYGKTKALKTISINIPQRQVTTLIGPSGCGKSTLLRCFNRMNDLIHNIQISGQIHINGHNIYAPKTDIPTLRKKVGMVFQKPNPFPNSIRSNITYALKIHGIRNQKTIEEKIESSLRAARLWDEVKDRLNTHAFQLSGGQQQRLCIARTIATQPEIILMDEPASELDPIAATAIQELILTLKQNLTIILATHNLQQATRISDQTAFLQQGKLIEIAPTQTIFTNPTKKQTENYITGRPN